MKLVVDTNVLITIFWKNSVFQRLSIKQNLGLFSPLYALEEINKNKQEILEKTKLSLNEFESLRRDLAIRIEFIPLEEYSSFLKKAESLAIELKEEDILDFLKDIDFFALALKLMVPIWSNDKQFKKQSKIKVFTTEELIKEFDD